MVVGIANIAILPVYLRLLGPELYGLVGFYTTLSSILVILDLGLSSTLNRELAIFSSVQGHAQKTLNKVRTLEYVYWATGIMIGLLVAAFSGLIAQYIIHSSLSIDTIRTSIIFMGIVIGLKWPSALYIGGLIGLQKHVAYNTFNISLELVKMVATLLALVFIKADLTTFFSVQIGYYFIYSIIFALLLWRKLPKTSERARYDRSELKEVWRFASGMTAISLVSVMLTQVDKAILIRILPLSTFGYYSLATSISSGLYRIIGPIDQSFYPRIVQLVSAGQMENLISTYHKAAQFMAVAILPIAVFICFFSRDFIFLWTRDQATTAQVSSLLSILVLGTALHGLMFIPYALQLAYGWTRFALYQNAISIIILVPVLYFLALRMGALGAAIVWVLLNIGYVFIALPVMHRKLLETEKMKWYKEDFAIPLLTCVGAALVFKVVVSSLPFDSVLRYLVIAAAFVLTYFLSIYTTSSTRNLAFSIINRSRYA